MQWNKGKWQTLGLGLAVLAVAVGLITGPPLGRSSAAAISPNSGGAAPSAAGAARMAVWVVHVYYGTIAERDRLAVDLGAEETDTRDGYLTVLADDALFKHIQGLGLRYTVDQKETDRLSDPHLFGDTFYNGFKTVEEMQTYLDQYVAAYPTLAQKVNIGDSWCKANPGQCTQPDANNGYSIWALHITNQAIPGPKPVYWYEAGIHAREIAVPEIAMRYISLLLDGYNSDPDMHWLVDYHDIWVVPMLNPDGHHIVESGGGGASPYYQRKNGNHTNGCNVWPPSVSNQFGTDNNRNFIFLWNCCGGSSGAACSETYHGSSSGSDPETQASMNQVRLLIPDQRGPNNSDPAPITTTGVFQDMHSNASLNLYPWGWTTTAAPNGPELANLGKHIQAPNAYPAGNSYQACQPPNCLYAVDGDAIDWAYGELGAAAFTTEVGGSDFLVPLSYVDGTLWPANKGPLVYEAKIARQPYLLAHGPDTSAVATNPMTVTQGTTTQLTATINYAWTGNSFAQNVGAAEYYLDTPPWAGGTAVAMSGPFGGAQTVTANATVDTTTIAPGRHLLFVRGRGVSPFQGYFTWGPVAAAWLWVTPPPGTATPTVTGTPPTATQTRTPTSTPAVPSATPTLCAANSNYTYQTATAATIVPGSTDTGSHCDDCLTTITLPFPVTLYDQSFTNANVDSNGTLQLVAGSSNYQNACLPASGATYTIYGHWDDLCTGACGSSSCTGCGVFTSMSGSAPNRILNVEWRAVLYSGGGAVNFEVRLYESTPSFDLIYGNVSGSGGSATTGVQKDDTHYTQFSCGTAVLTPGLRVSYTLPACGTVTTTPSPLPASSTATATATPSNTPAAGPTNTASPTPAGPTPTPGGPSATPAPSNTATRVPGTATPAPATATPCLVSFSDVHAADYFYTPVLYLACHGVISGYSNGDGTFSFRPYNQTTRAQMVKIVVLGDGKAIVTPAGGAYTFADVPPTNPFFAVIETAAADTIISGYTCGGPNEPCDNLNRPYFRPAANVTRGQLSKIAVVAAGWALVHPPAGSFADVLPNTAFYLFVETASCHSIISGYSCGGVGEPCDSTNRPYFRPYNPATRGQIAKIVYLSITGTACASAATPTPGPSGLSAP
ncbi:MAG TPA: M14 family zinc carboxypeptidase [Chloroflexia bacterium]|nr:M14 family zinc carboxypeptidase [Chloroflexia bacterium]